MLSLRYFFRLTKAFIFKFKFLITIGSLLGILFFFLIFTLGPKIVPTKTEKIGVTGRYLTENLPYPILIMITDGLTRLLEDGTVEPSLAKSWFTPDKGKTWIFTVNDELQWHDGTRVKSYDIHYEFSDVEVEYTDENTITFKLQQPFSLFPVIVSKPTFKAGLLGTGDWSVKSISLNGNYIQELLLENKGDDKTKKGKLLYKFYPTEDATKLAFKLGEIDYIENLLNSSPFNTWENVDIKQEINTNQVVVVIFNNKDKILSEKKLRQALVYAVDKENMNGPRAISPISPNSWAYNPKVKEYGVSVQRAKELIDELPSEIKENLHIKLVSAPSLLTTAESIALQWKEAGVDTLVQVSSVIPSDFQAYLTIFDIPPDPDQYSMWHSTQQNTNISSFIDPRIDKLLEDGRSELFLEERKIIYMDFQRFLLEDLPAAFLYHPTYFDIIRK